MNKKNENCGHKIRDKAMMDTFSFIYLLKFS